MTLVRDALHRLSRGQRPHDRPRTRRAPDICIDSRARSSASNGSVSPRTSSPCRCTKTADPSLAATSTRGWNSQASSSLLSGFACPLIRKSVTSQTSPCPRLVVASTTTRGKSSSGMSLWWAPSRRSSDFAPPLSLRFHTVRPAPDSVRMVSLLAFR